MKYFSGILSLFVSVSFFAQVPPRSTGGNYEGIKAPSYMPPSVPRSEGEGMTIFQENKKYGVRNLGKVTVTPQYDKLDFANTGLIATKGNLKGVIEGNGKVLLPLQYDDITTDRVFYIAKKGKSTEIFRPDLKLFAKGDFSRIIFYNNEILITDDYDGKQSFIFSNGTVIKNKYTEATLFLNLLVVKLNDKFGILKDGKEVSGLVYDDLYFQRNMYDNKPKPYKGIVEIRENAKYLIGIKDKKFGILDHSGKTALPFEYEKINLDYDKRSYYVFQNNLVGIFLNENKKLSPQFKSVEKRDQNYNVSKAEKYVLLNADLQQNPNLESEAPIEALLSSKYLKVKKSGKLGLTDSNGNLLIPFEYDGFDYLDYDRQHLITVKNKDKTGLFDLNQKKLIIPVQYEYLNDNDDFIIGFNEIKKTLFNYNGQKVLPDDYERVAPSNTENSPIYFLEKDDLYTVITKDQKVLMKDILSYRYIYDEDLLINPFHSGRSSILALQHKNGKYALFSEFEKKTVSPFEYDNIVQKFDGDKLYFVVVKNKKYGIVDAQNTVIVDFLYDEISLSKLHTMAKPLSFVAKKNNKYGVIDLSNTVLVPFKYSYLEKISVDNLFKAKTGKTYQLISERNEVLNPNTFDEIAPFEGKEALTFSKGKMKVINNKGVLTGVEEEMQPHDGYKTFDEMKFALIQAFDSKDDEALKVFVKKVAPSKHVFYFLKNNIFNRKELYYNESGLEFINKKYFEDLREFKYNMWNSIYHKTSLTDVTDFTIHKRGIVTNARTQDHAFGDTRFLEMVLRDAIKINGFWISSYFMSGRF
ncbi:WG repeat-containing protein [Chryseobacterium sp. NKUCC03_KSP]|uniref:WG repeat-containing protein n=1 Tax=Chryseobacterium sp. NKUCC03_KSP TaxID=2842125 RepID=UPI001C5B1943|nr:WG repeat-containing protein [Chryseobacterium sp. NKUCC03_KSP]MBW3520916.1 WG repeat-containing protein [Chryseobacterium sp. NKUCC03_KSP]